MKPNIDPVAAAYLESHPQDAARALARLEQQELSAFLSEIPVNLAAKVLAFMPATAAKRFLSELASEAAAKIVQSMPTAAAAERLQEMERNKLHAILGLLPRTVVMRLRIRLRYPGETVGALTEPDVFSLPYDIRVADAFRLARSSTDRITHYVYVLDRRHRLRGMTDLCELMTQADSVPIARLLRPVPAVFNARTSLRSVQDHPACTSYDNLPVVDREDRFQGILLRDNVYRERQNLVTDRSEQQDLAATQLALADVFWLAGSVFFAGGQSTDQNPGD